MGFDAIIKRYFPAVLGVLLAFAAYFQASGMGQLVVASVALDPSALPAAGPASRTAVSVKDAYDHARDGQPILARNPFDSVTGPLDGKPLDISAPSATVDANRDPYDDPYCDFAKVLVIATSSDDEWSFAALAGTDNKTQLRRKGDEFAGHKVDFIGDRRESEDLRGGDLYERVWLLSGGTRCQVKVGGPPPKGGPAPAAAASASPEGRSKRKVPAEIANKIHKVSDREFNVERSVIDSILENQSELMKSARIVPEKEGDKVVGIRLFGIRSESLLGTLGLQNGDRLNNINGFDMADPQKALEAYTRLKTADRLTVSINRGGSPMNIDFNIK